MVSPESNKLFVAHADCLLCMCSGRACTVQCLSVCKNSNVVISIVYI